MKRARVVAAAVALVLALALVGCGKSQSTSQPTSQSTQSGATTSTSVHFAKTKFVLHAGLAFGAVHRYIYAPFRAGSFHAGQKGRVVALAKAGAAALFAYHELHLAIDDVKGDPTLSKLVTPIQSRLDSLPVLGTKLRNGTATPADINGANSYVGSVHGQAAQQGVNIKDITPPASAVAS